MKSINRANSKPSQVEIVQPKRGIWRTYDATDGLPGGVECLLQDRHGYLWLGMGESGVCRFDGVEFITYTTASLPQRQLMDEIFMLGPSSLLLPTIRISDILTHI